MQHFVYFVAICLFACACMCVYLMCVPEQTGCCSGRGIYNPTQKKMVVVVLWSNTEEENRKENSIWGKMKTQTPCELCVTDGCISIRESQMQWRRDVLHVDKACHIAGLNSNKVVLFYIHAMRLSLIYFDAKLTILLQLSFIQLVIQCPKMHYNS